MEGAFIFALEHPFVAATGKQTTEMHTDSRNVDFYLCICRQSHYRLMHDVDMTISVPINARRRTTRSRADCGRKWRYSVLTSPPLIVSATNIHYSVL